MFMRFIQSADCLKVTNVQLLKQTYCLSDEIVCIFGAKKTISHIVKNGAAEAEALYSSVEEVEVEANQI